MFRRQESLELQRRCRSCSLIDVVIQKCGLPSMHEADDLEVSVIRVAYVGASENA